MQTISTILSQWFLNLQANLHASSDNIQHGLEMKVIVYKQVNGSSLDSRHLILCRAGAGLVSGTHNQTVHAVVCYADVGTCSKI